MVSLAEESPVNARQMGCEPPLNTAEAKPLVHIIAARGCVKRQADQGGGLLQSCLGGCDWLSNSCLTRPRSLGRSDSSELISSTPPVGSWTTR